jgi:hypothetical protein
MAKKGPASYSVAVTAIRNYVPSTGAPRRDQVWTFSQTVRSANGYPGALRALAKLFFNDYKKPSGEGMDGDFALLLPSGKRGQIVITRSNQERLDSYLNKQRSSNSSDYDLQSSDASLRITKLRALSGETPTTLAPRSEKELSDRLRKNVESIRWWQDPIVQMPTPIYVNEKAAKICSSAPTRIKYKGSTYRLAIAWNELPVEKLKPAFFAEMEYVAEEMTGIHDLLMQAGEQFHEGFAADATTLLQKAAQRTYKHVLTSILNARDIASKLNEPATEPPAPEEHSKNAKTFNQQVEPGT